MSECSEKYLFKLIVIGDAGIGDKITFSFVFSLKKVLESHAFYLITLIMNSKKNTV